MMPSPVSTVPIIVLAAGLSRRMRGRDKLLEDVDGTPLLALQIERARGATSGKILVTLPPPPHPRHQIVDRTLTDVVVVDRPEDGMSASLKAGLSALPADAPAAMIMLPDLPDLDTADLKAVLAAVDLASDSLIWRGATEDGRPGHPVVFRSDLFKALATLDGDQGGAAVAKSHFADTVLVSLPGDRALRDLDTPEEWARWRAET